MNDRPLPPHLLARRRKIAKELRLDIGTQEHWNHIHPDQPIHLLDGLDPDLPDEELLEQFQRLYCPPMAKGGSA